MQPSSSPHEMIYDVLPAALVELDGELRIQRANGRAETVLGRGRLLTGRAYWDGTGLSRSLQSALAEVLSSGQTFTFWGYPLAGVDGESFFWDLTIRRISSADGSAPCLMLFGVDVTSRVLAERGMQDAVARARRSTEKLRSIVEQMTDGVVICSASGELETMNEAARDMLGEGARGSAVLTNDGAPLPPADLPWVRAAVLGEPARGVDLTVQRPRGSELAVSVNAAPLLDENASRVGSVAALRDVTARYATIAELREANARLAENSRLKSEFVANMSHELRTPLNAILGFTQLMKLAETSEPLTPKQGDFLERILRNGHNLLTLIDGILDVARIEAGMRTMHPEHFDLREALEESFGSLESLAQQKKLAYTMKVHGELPLVFTDRNRLRQIIVNLLSNALKFTTEGSVSLVVRREGDNAVIEVSDTGVGMKPESLGTIFDRFRQVDGSTTRSAGGIGLGLSISKELTALLGGELQVESAFGRGSLFRLVLPLDTVVPDVVPLLDEAEATVPRSERPSDATSGPLVLVIEDNPDSAVLLRETLEASGFRVRLAENGVAGLRLARSINPAAITLDIMMPRMDGWRVLQALREDTRTADVPVIVCSIVDNRLMGYRLGASEYLTKPVDPRALLSALSRVGATASLAGGGHVLVVDDEKAMRDTVAASLDTERFEVRQASTGERALEMVTADPPRAIYLDVMLPGGMSGFEVLARLRSRPETADIPVVMLTGRDLSPEERQRLGGRIAHVVRTGELDMKELAERLRAALPGLARDV